MRHGFSTRPLCIIGCVPCSVSCAVKAFDVSYWQRQVDALLDFQPEPYEDEHAAWSDRLDRTLASLERSQESFRANRLMETAPPKWAELQRAVLPAGRTLH